MRNVFPPSSGWKSLIFKLEEADSSEKLVPHLQNTRPDVLGHWNIDIYHNGNLTSPILR